MYYRPSLFRASLGAILFTVCTATAAQPLLAATDIARTGPTRRALVTESEYDALRVPHHADLAPREALTIELWLKRDATSTAACGMLVGKDRTTGYWLAVCEGRLRFGVGPAAFSDGGRVLPVGRWTHVAVTFDGVERRFYVDGTLDRVAREDIAPLVDGRSELVLGADARLGMPFAGKLDTVRLWRTARTEAQIRGALWEVLAAQPGLVAQWTLDGHGDDSIGAHDGRAAAGASYTFDGALPRDVTVPLTTSRVEVDGRCEATEYGSAERVAIDNAAAPRVYLQATTTDVYVCVADLHRPTGVTGFAALYVDRNASRDDSLQFGDYRFTINARGNTEVQEPDGRGGWRKVDLIDGTWQVARMQTDNSWSAEFRFARSLLERPADPDSLIDMGLALTVSTTRSDAGDDWWPVRATESAPSTWVAATFATEPGLPPVFIFEGRVERQPDEDGPPTARPQGLGGAVVQLYVVDEDRIALVDEALTDEGGHWRVDFRGYAPEGFIVREINPRGATSVSADAGGVPEGEATAPDVIRYDLGIDPPQENRIFRGARFIDRVGPPLRQSLARHYLIVHAAPVTENDLWPFIEAKERQGFRVRTMSVAELERVGSGEDVGARVQEWIASIWRDVEPEPVYALLIGRGDRIPVRDVGWLDNDHRTPGQPDYYPAWPTDWYYADVDSDWDADGDGFYGEFMRCKPGETYPHAEAPGGRRACPEEGSLSREGPFGTLRGTEDDFEPDVSVGRLAVSSPGEVRRALAASMAFEESGASDKRRGLIAGGFWTFEGRGWVAEDLTFAGGGSSKADAWIGRPWDGERPFGHDTATALDGRLRPVLALRLDQITRLYETLSPGGDPSLSPSLALPDAALTASEFDLRWRTQRAALVNLAGNGTPDGLVTAHWLHDWDGNRHIEQPARPNTCSERPVSPLEQIGPPCWELIPERFVDGLLGEPAGLPPLVVANAGLTGNVAWDWQGADASGNVLGLRMGPSTVASTLTGRGSAAAWIGSYVPVAPGALDNYQTTFNSLALNTSLRLGDAHWRAAATLAENNPFDMRSYGMMLFGDPALSYWGNPADTDAPWGQQGRDWQATGGSPQAGPALPERAWAFSELGPNSPAVVSSDGTLYIGGAGRVLRTTGGGALIGQAEPVGNVGNIRFSPAVARDGIYIAAGGSLHSFDRDLALRAPVNMPGGAAVTGAPRVDADGAVWVPTGSGMVRVTGDGRATLAPGGPAAGPVVFMLDGRVAWPTAAGRIQTWLRDQAGEVSTGMIGSRAIIGLTDLAVGAGGTVYAGSEDGRLHAYPFRDGDAGTSWQAATGASIRVAPAVAPGGVIIAANERGTVVAFAGGTGTELWRTELGRAVTAAPTADGAQVFVVAGDRLYALLLAEGQLLWTRDLGASTDERSTPVIGADRTLYITRADNVLLAMRESGWLSTPAQVMIDTTPGPPAVRWRDTSTNEIGFRVELCDRFHDCLNIGTAGAGQTSMIIDEMPFDAGEPYYARVLAIGRADAEGLEGLTVQQSNDANKSSEWARSTWATAPADPPVAVTRLQIDATSSDALTLRWDYPADSAHLLGFRVRRAASVGGPFVDVANVGSEVRQFVDRERQPRTTYFYRVITLGEDEEAAAAQASGETLAQTLRAPTGLRVDAGRERVILQWVDRERDEDGYLIERRAPGTAHWAPLGRLAANARSFVDTYHLEDGAYHYRVRAVSETSESPWATISGRIGAAEEITLYLPFAFQAR